MIPKIIHYCWFGGKEIPTREKKCMESWIRIHPDFQIMRWDESTFNIEDYPFCKEAYRQGKFAYVADVARLVALHKYGGIYLDTDVELLRPLSDLMNNQLVMGFETDNIIQTGLIASAPENSYIEKMLGYYKSKSGFDAVDVALPNSALFAEMFRKEGIPLDNKEYRRSDLFLLPSEYFCPINQATWEIRATENSYCIHYLSGSWLDKKHRISRKIKSIAGSIIGFETLSKIRNFIFSSKK